MENNFELTKSNIFENLDGLIIGRKHFYVLKIFMKIQMLVILYIIQII